MRTLDFKHAISSKSENLHLFRKENGMVYQNKAINKMGDNGTLKSLITE